MTHSKILPTALCLMLAACASASPEDVQMANNMCAQGKSLLAMGKTAEARDLYASATRRDDENPRAWNGLGVADDLLGKRSEAEDAYKQALALAPKDLTARNNLAHLYLAEGDADDAVRLLEPYGDDPAATPTLRQNLAAARKATQGGGADSYADLGSYPTEGMAQAHLNEARKILDDDAEGVNFAVLPEVKIAGGTPVFTAKATGKPPQDICDDLNPKAFPCVPHGK